MKRKLLMLTALALCLALLCGCTTIATSEWMQNLFPVGDEAVAEIKLRSRQYAKRQLTWLRRNRDIHWFYRKNSRDLPAALHFSTEILTNLGVS